MIIKELIWIEIANEASYIGRLLPKNPGNRIRRKKLK